MLLNFYISASAATFSFNANLQFFPKTFAASSSDSLLDIPFDTRMPASYFSTSSSLSFGMLNDFFGFSFGTFNNLDRSLFGPFKSPLDFFCNSLSALLHLFLCGFSFRLAFFLLNSEAFSPY
jgi:hypothetical protein